MAKQIARAGRHPVKQPIKASKAPKWEFPLNKKNFIILAIGICIIFIGYLLMATGISSEPAVPNGKWNNVFAVQIAPIVLVVGYCIVIPYGILKFFGGNKDEAQQQQK